MRSAAMALGVIALAGLALGMSPVMPEDEDTPGYEVRVTSSGLN